MNRTYVEAAMYRALIRASRRGDLLTHDGALRVIRELVDGERVALKELPEAAK